MLAAVDPLPPFNEVGFNDFAHEPPLRSAELSAWLEQAPGHSWRIREQLPACVIDGVARLRSPWREDLALRLGLWDHHGLRIHFWSGRRGVTLWYYQYPATWVAYHTTRDSAQPQPKTYALAAQDDHRFSRTAHGSFELRHAGGRLYMTRGDMLLLSAALEQAPTEVYFEGHANIRGISLVRIDGLPEPPQQRPAVLQSDQPAELAWRTDLPVGASLHRLPDGSLELTAEKTKSWTHIWLPYPETGLYEVIFQIDQPQPGTSVFLGNEQGRPQHRVAFLRDSRSGQTSLSFLAPAGSPQRVERRHCPAARAVCPQAALDQADPGLRNDQELRQRRWSALQPRRHASARRRRAESVHHAGTELRANRRAAPHSPALRGAARVAGHEAAAAPRAA